MLQSRNTASRRAGPALAPERGMRLAFLVFLPAAALAHGASECSTDTACVDLCHAGATEYGAPQSSPVTTLTGTSCNADGTFSCHTSATTSLGISSEPCSWPGRDGVCVFTSA